MSAFVVDAHTPGLTVAKKEGKLGLRASPTADLILEDVIVPVKYRIGEGNAAFYLLMKTLDASRPTIGGSGTGDCGGSVRIRCQICERTPTIRAADFEFQDLQWLIADMATKVEAARALLY